MLGCNCPTDRRLFLNVGRAVQLRGRLQCHAFGRSSHDPSPWIEEFSSEPHDHLVMVSVWYVPKHELGVAETWLIDNLKPIKNKRDRGYSIQSQWNYRLPDVDGITIDNFEPDPSHKRYVARNSDLRHEPGVYAWWVDAGAELLAAHSIVKAIFPHKTHTEGEKTLRSKMAERLRSYRRAIQR